MAIYPEGLTLRTVTGSVDPGTDVLFRIPEWLIGPADDLVYRPREFKPDVDDQGNFDIELPINNDPEWSPFQYYVRLQSEGKILKGAMDVPSGTGALDIADQVIVDQAPVSMVDYLDSTDIGARVAGLEGGVVPPEQLPAEFPPATHSHSGPVLLAEGPVPSPSPDTIVLYSIDLDGNTVPRMMLPEGLVVDPIRDTTFVVRNATGGTLVKGVAVYANGIHPGSGVIPTVAPARADSKTTMPVIGVMFESVPNNAFGRVMVQGRINDLNTTAYTAGAPLYLSATTAGQMTTTPPTHPNYLSVVGVCLRSNAVDGALAINMANFGGDDVGTAQNAFAIGNGQAGSKDLLFKNGFTGTLRASHTAARTWTLPDTTGTLATATDLTALTGKLPADNGYSGWMYPPDLTLGSFTLASPGVGYVFRMRVMSSQVSNIHIFLTAGGAGLTTDRCFVTMHNDAGAIMGLGAVTADQSVNWASAGIKNMPLAVPMGTTPGQYYKFRLWYAGATGPTLTRAGVSSSINAGLAAPNFHYSTADTGLTDANSGVVTKANLGAMTGASNALWMAVSP